MFIFLMFRARVVFRDLFSKFYKLENSEFRLASKFRLTII
jgi:hypothetical protein